MNNFALKLANVMILVFPLMFAANVYICFNKEAISTLNFDHEEYGKLIQPSEVYVEEINSNSSTTCNVSTTIIFNASLAVLLAYMWNATKAIKMGAI
jgi:hypothetical protein